LFIAVGVFAILLGMQCLVVEKAIMTAPADQSSRGWGLRQSSTIYREVVPPDWAPWSLLSVGAVVCLYSFTIPQKMKG
jgi:hypothetical protein